jgi:hypothetical protein
MTVTAWPPAISAFFGVVFSRPSRIKALLPVTRAVRGVMTFGERGDVGGVAIVAVPAEVSRSIPMDSERGGSEMLCHCLW